MYRRLNQTRSKSWISISTYIDRYIKRTNGTDVNVKTYSVFICIVQILSFLPLACDGHFHTILTNQKPQPSNRIVI
jgi:hypothetical protein